MTANTDFPVPHPELQSAIIEAGLIKSMWAACVIFWWNNPFEV